MATIEEEVGDSDPKKLMPRQVRLWVKRLGEDPQLVGDDEAQSGAEHSIHKIVLLAIASGARFPRALAGVALCTYEVDFHRW